MHHQQQRRSGVSCWIAILIHSIPIGVWRSMMITRDRWDGWERTWAQRSWGKKWRHSKLTYCRPVRGRRLIRNFCTVSFCLVETAHLEEWLLIISLLPRILDFFRISKLATITVLMLKISQLLWCLANSIKNCVCRALGPLFALFDCPISFVLEKYLHNIPINNTWIDPAGDTKELMLPNLTTS